MSEMASRRLLNFWLCGRKKPRLLGSLSGSPVSDYCNKKINMNKNTSVDSVVYKKAFETVT